MFSDTEVQFGTPVLECEGQVLQGNSTIAKFLAAKYSKLTLMLIDCYKPCTCNADMGGASEEEKKAAEEIIDTTEQIWDKMSRFFWEKDEAKKVKPRAQ